MEYTAEQLELMLNSKHWPDRWAVARKGYRLDVLMFDEEAHVRYAVAQQGYGLETLMRDDDESVRKMAQRMNDNKNLEVPTVANQNNMSLDDFKNVVRAMGGIWSGNDVHFTQYRDGFSASYKPDFPEHSQDDCAVSYNCLEDKWNYLSPEEYDAQYKQVGHLEETQREEVEIHLVGSVVRGDQDYLEGSVSIAGVLYPFDYNMKTEDIEIHSYSPAGWIAGSSYEKPLPAVVADNMEEILSVIQVGVDEFFQETALDVRIAAVVAPETRVAVNKEITNVDIERAIRCLEDNGIEEDEAGAVLQALGYILLDAELLPESNYPEKSLKERLADAEKRSRATIPSGDDGSGPNGGAGGDPVRVKEKHKDDIDEPCI